jgi:hypothetical protein
MAVGAGPSRTGRASKDCAGCRPLTHSGRRGAVLPGDLVGVNQYRCRAGLDATCPGPPTMQTEVPRDESGPTERSESERGMVDCHRQIVKDILRPSCHVHVVNNNAR